MSDFEEEAYGHGFHNPQEYLDYLCRNAYKEDDNHGEDFYFEVLGEVQEALESYTFDELISLPEEYNNIPDIETNETYLRNRYPEFLLKDAVDEIIESMTEDESVDFLVKSLKYNYYDLEDIILTKLNELGEIAFKQLLVVYSEGDSVESQASYRVLQSSRISMDKIFLFLTEENTLIRRGILKFIDQSGMKIPDENLLMLAEDNDVLIQELASRIFEKISRRAP